MLGTVDRFGHRSGNSSRSGLVGPTDNKQGTAAGIAHTIRRLLDRHYAERITLDVIGDALGLSPFKILRNFQRCYGISPHRYLIERRVSKASALLLDGVRPAEVAVLVGFVDQSHLTKHFKRIWGMTPGRFYATRRSAPAGPDAAAAWRGLGQRRCDESLEAMCRGTSSACLTRPGVLTQPIVGAFDLDDHGVVQELGREHGGDDRIAEDLAPSGPRVRVCRPRDGL